MLFPSSASVTSNLHKASLPSPTSAVINHETHRQAPAHQDRHGARSRGEGGRARAVEEERGVDEAQERRRRLGEEAAVAADTAPLLRQLLPRHAHHRPVSLSRLVSVLAAFFLRATQVWCLCAVRAMDAMLTGAGPAMVFMAGLDRCRARSWCRAGCTKGSCRACPRSLLPGR